MNSFEKFYFLQWLFPFPVEVQLSSNNTVCHFLSKICMWHTLEHRTQKNKKLEISLFLSSTMDKPRFKAVLRKEMYNVPSFANKHKISALTKMIGQQIKENPSLTQIVTDCLLWRGTVVSPKLPTISLIESLVQNHRDMLLSPISSIVSEVFQSIFKSGNERVWIRTKLKIVLFRTKYFRLSLSFVQPVGPGITCSQRLLSIPLILQCLRWTVSGPHSNDDNRVGYDFAPKL